MFSIKDENPAAAGKELANFISHGGILLFVPGRSKTRPATPIHIPSSHLKTLVAFQLPTLPIAIDCPPESCMGIEKNFFTSSRCLLRWSATEPKGNQYSKLPRAHARSF